MKRGAALRRNPVRAARAFAENFGEKAAWIRTLPCCICGGRGQTQAAHAKSRGAGGTAEHLVPLCLYCHDEQHLSGVRTFEARWGVDLLAIARRFEADWLIFSVAP